MAIVTVSRQYGTGGILMARQLAERLGGRFIFRDELIPRLRGRGLEIVLERIEGRPPSLFERLFRVNRETLRENLRAVMEEEADKPGNLVIGGWGGQIFLKDRKDALHVRVIGPKESRIRYL
ncbi:MAG: cytidylate kinase family protein, partial [bacterium]